MIQTNIRQNENSRQSRYDLEEIKEKISRYVLASLKQESEPDDEKLKDIIADVISEDLGDFQLSLSEKRELAINVFNSLRRLDVIEPMMQDPSVTEIMVNGPDKIFYEKNGRLYKSNHLQRYDSTV